jgi:hypothetical protein
MDRAPFQSYRPALQDLQVAEFFWVWEPPWFIPLYWPQLGMLPIQIGEHLRWESIGFGEIPDIQRAPSLQASPQISLTSVLRFGSLQQSLLFRDSSLLFV